MIDALPKMRTIDQTYIYLKKLDPETAITKHLIRLLVMDGKIPSMKVGNKHLLDISNVLSFFDSYTYGCGDTSEVNKLDNKKEGLKKIRKIPEKFIAWYKAYQKRGDNNN